MPTWLTVSLIVVVLALLVTRLLTPGLPINRWARPIGAMSMIIALVGALGLVLHCGAMFFGDVLAVIPGSGGYAEAVNNLGPASKILYVVPAAAVLVGFRAQQPVALVVVAVTLLAVGITMYNDSPLNLHLTTITAAVLAISGTGALLLRPGRVH